MSDDEVCHSTAVAIVVTAYMNALFGMCTQSQETNKHQVHEKILKVSFFPACKDIYVLVMLNYRMFRARDSSHSDELV